MTRHAWMDSPLGRILLVSHSIALSGVYFADQHNIPDVSERGVEAADDPVLRRAAMEVTEFLDGRRDRFDVPLAPRGNDFEQRVWILTRTIPSGHTRTCQEIASQLGRPRETAAVARALMDNPLMLVVPSHRVVDATEAETDEQGVASRLLSMERIGAA